MKAMYLRNTGTSESVKIHTRRCDVTVTYGSAYTVYENFEQTYTLSLILQS